MAAAKTATPLLLPAPVERVPFPWEMAEQREAVLVERSAGE